LASLLYHALANPRVVHRSDGAQSDNPERDSGPTPLQRNFSDPATSPPPKRRWPGPATRRPSRTPFQTAVTYQGPVPTQGY
jgi:hypothetical protein